MFKKLLSETVIYGGTTILTRLVSYALVPLHTGVFKVDDYGIVSLFFTYIVFFNVVYTYGMETAFFRFSNLKGENKEKVFNQIMTSLLFTSVLFSGIGIYFSQNIAEALGYSNAQHYVVWIFMLIAIDAIVSVPFAKLRLEKKATLFASYKIVNVLIMFGLNYFFLLTCPSILKGESFSSLKPFVESFYDPNLGYGYVFLANLIANSTYLLMFVKDWLRLKFVYDKELYSKILNYGLPLVISGLAFAVNEVADRQLLFSWLPDGFYAEGDGEYAVGVYSACYKLSIFITMSVMAFKYAAEPFFFARAGEKNSKNQLSIIMRYFVIVLAMMYVGILANVDWIAPILIRKPEYLVGLNVVPILLMANIFLGIYYNLAIWYKLTDKTRYGAVISTIGALITISINFILIPKYGYFGSAIATFSAYGSMMVISYLLGQKHYPVPYTTKNSLIHLFVAVVLGYVCFFEISAGTLGLILKNGIVAVYILGTLFIEKKKLQNLQISN
ncbi:MATE family efflux transporter [Sediminitomix flava]|uniref:O-antigen/teichoic acid export membrane protein n=1 Tax=Sediminitomix flava TaxID=379075 RepID=A0A315ZXR4_SEDFL|nr:polysaccharide biosynthesis C-terminal domain-containing protein [Sediminitomix flava]PWJ42137.1 O-antigen/teichoic acid export membrane protein [Sediminitomix flava]